jgi:hypothetical protein
MKSAAGKYVRPCSNIEANRLWALTRIEELRLMFDEEDQSIGAAKRAVLNTEFAHMLASLVGETEVYDFINAYKKSLDTVYRICMDAMYARVIFPKDPSWLAIEHHQLNLAGHTMTVLPIQEYFGRASNVPIREGLTLWSRLNWVLSVPCYGVARAVLGIPNEPDSTIPCTVMSLWKHIQHDLRRTADVIDAALLSDLIVALKGEDGLGGMNASLNNLCEEADKVGATGIIWKSNDLLKKSKDFYELIEGASEKRTKLGKLFATIRYEPFTDSVSCI